MMPTRTFHTLTTSLLTIVLLVLLYFLFNPFTRPPWLEQLHYAGESAGRMMDRHMEFYAGYENVGPLQRRLHAFLFGDRASVEADAIQTYREVLEFFRQHPKLATPWAQLNTEARLLVTLGETGRIEALKQALAGLEDQPEQEMVAEAIRYAYLDDKEADLPSVMYGARMLPLGWAADSLWIRIAQRRGDKPVEEIVRRRQWEQGAHLRLQVLRLSLAVAVVIVAGLLLLWRQRLFSLMPAWPGGALQRPWTAREGYAVAVRSAVAGLLIVIVLQLWSTHFFRPGLLASWSTLFASLPMLWWMRRRLLSPRELGFRSAFGLSLAGMGWKRFAAITLGFLALDWLGMMLISWLAWHLGLTGHWAEGVDERLIFGPSSTLWLGVINLAVFTPVLEELGFRGLIYTSMRSRLRPATAIPLSALLFSLLHLYSLPGFLTVFWSGLILAWIYERYRSLLPGMVIHGAGNLLSFTTVVLFYT
jgi:membrane protease YdiL (CAAX protease family)